MLLFWFVAPILYPYAINQFFRSKLSEIKYSFANPVIQAHMWIRWQIYLWAWPNPLGRFSSGMIPEFFYLPPIVCSTFITIDSLFLTWSSFVFLGVTVGLKWKDSAFTSSDLSLALQIYYNYIIFRLRCIFHSKYNITLIQALSPS